MKSYYGWQVSINKTHIDLLHEESGHSFEFQRKVEEPYFVEEAFSGHEGQDTHIEYKDCVDRAFEIAYEIAAKAAIASDNLETRDVLSQS